MKKYFAIAIAALLLLCSLASCVQADPNAIDNYTPDINYMETEVGTFYFAEAEGETAILTSFKSKDNKNDNVEIPAEFKGRTVSAIGDSAFYGLASVVSVKIPETVTVIGKAAFARCANLTAIELPAGVISVGAEAFAHCENLTSVKLGNALVSIEDHAFWYCEKLTAVEFPATLETIGEGAFWNCKGLTALTFPASLKTVGTLAFYNCQGLPENIAETLPEGVEVGEYVFAIDENDVEEETEEVTEGATEGTTEPVSDAA